MKPSLLQLVQTGALAAALVNGQSSSSSTTTTSLEAITLTVLPVVSTTSSTSSSTLSTLIASDGSAAPTLITTSSSTATGSLSGTVTVTSYRTITDYCGCGIPGVSTIMGALTSTSSSSALSSAASSSSTSSSISSSSSTTTTTTGTGIVDPNLTSTTVIFSTSGSSTVSIILPPVTVSTSFSTSSTSSSASSSSSTSTSTILEGSGTIAGFVDPTLIFDSALSQLASLSSTSTTTSSLSSTSIVTSTSSTTSSVASTSSSTTSLTSTTSTGAITTASTSVSTTTTSTTTTTTTTTAGPIVTDQAYIDTVLRHHNVHRANHSSPALVWSPSLASTAQKIAAMCDFEHNTSVDGGGYGQNLGAGYPANSMGALITEGFYNSEVNAYTYYGGEPDTSTVGAWGHFSQVVWKSTTSVGCYTQDCSATGLRNAPGVPPLLTVCNYSPAGNVVGAFGTNVLRPLGSPTVFADYGCGSRTNCAGTTT